MEQDQLDMISAIPCHKIAAKPLKQNAHFFLFLFGARCSGKSSLWRRINGDDYRSSYQATERYNESPNFFKVAQTNIRFVNVEMGVVDYPGDISWIEKSTRKIRLHFRSIIFCFDVTREDGLESLQPFIEYAKNKGNKWRWYLVGTKIDMTH